MQTRHPFTAAARGARQVCLLAALGAGLAALNARAAPPMDASLTPAASRSASTAARSTCPIRVMTFYSRIDPDGSAQLHYRWVRADGTRAGVTAFAYTPGAHHPRDALPALPPWLLAPPELARAAAAADCALCAAQAPCADAAARARDDDPAAFAGIASAGTRAARAGVDAVPGATAVLHVEVAPGDCETPALARRFTAAPAPCLTR